MSKRFKPGDAVVVCNAYPPGHVRTPTYLKGKRGMILGDYGAWRNPEELAYGMPGLPKRINYWVQFQMDEVWGGNGQYGPNDTIAVEIYEHWLMPAEDNRRDNDAA
jgi:nitrile hydratase